MADPKLTFPGNFWRQIVEDHFVPLYHWLDKVHLAEACLVLLPVTSGLLALAAIFGITTAESNRELWVLSTLLLVLAHAFLLVVAEAKHLDDWTTSQQPDSALTEQMSLLEAQLEA